MEKLEQEKKLNFKWEYANGVEMSINVPEKLVGKEENNQMQFEASSIMLMMQFFNNRLSEIGKEIAEGEQQPKSKIIM